MPGKAPAAAAPTADALQQMIQEQDAARAFKVESGADGRALVGGQQIDPSQAARPLPQPGAPAMPRQEDDDNEPATPGQTTPPPPPVAPVYPGQMPGAMPVNFELEMRQAQERIAQLEQTMQEEARLRAEHEFDARIDSLPEDQRPAARLARERELRLQSELTLAGIQLKQSHPLFVQTMDALAAHVDVEIDPAQYREMAGKLEPLLQSIIAAAVTAEKAKLNQDVQQQWGIRPTPEQATPPAPDNPAVLRYKAARIDVTKRPTDPEPMRRMIAAGEEIRRLGIDVTLIR